MSLLTAEDQYRRAETFTSLHAGPDVFVIANAWDAGTAKIFTALGFRALATTSAGIAHSLGKGDGSITREQSLANARLLVGATHLPVAADLENGYGTTADGRRRDHPPGRRRRPGRRLDRGRASGTRSSRWRRPSNA